MTLLTKYIAANFGLSIEKASVIKHLFERETLEKGTFYVHNGNRCDKMSFIDKGLLRIYRDFDGKDITQWISSKGYFITDLNSWLFKHPARLNIIALTDVTLYTISRKNYSKINDLISNWNEIEKAFIGHCFITLEERVFSFLSLSSEERYLKFYEENKHLFNEIPLHYIASMLGMTPETFSRIRKKQLV